MREAIEVRLVMAQLHNALLRLGFERYASVHVERASGIPAMMVFQKVEATLVKGK